MIHPLEALTHFDGRNAEKLTHLRRYFSETSWMKYRLRVMVSYIEFLVSQKIINSPKRNLAHIWQSFSLEEAKQVKVIETNTKHDVRSLELYLKIKLGDKSHTAAMVNFGMGSEDINNVALRLIIRDVYSGELLPNLVGLTSTLMKLTESHIDLPILARTHGQPASVSTFGKELSVFLDRLVNEIEGLIKIQFRPKFSGEVGTFASSMLTLPQVDWVKLEKKFLEMFDFRNPSPATQIPPYDDLIRFFDSLRRINQVLIALAKDLWLYASFNYISFVQPTTEVGSAGMPHKINPQYFEGAEGGLELANAIFEFLSRKLSYSRLQRDFSDSTVRRNMVIPISYCILSYESLIVGLTRLKVIASAMQQDIDHHWEVLSDSLTTYLKYRGVNEAYEVIKNHVRGKSFTKEEWIEMVKILDVDSVTRSYFQDLKPEDLTDGCERLVRNSVRKAEDVLKAVRKFQSRQPY